MNLKLSFLFFSIHIFSALTAKATTMNIDESIDAYLKKHANFSGAVLVAHNGNILFKKGYGCADYELTIPNSPETKFAIASNTKPFTALAIMQLQEKKILNVHDTVNNYIPDFGRGDEITIHHLLTHTAGIKNLRSKNWADVADCTNLNEMAAAIKLWDLESEPGTTYNYSNPGYAVLAYIIEIASGIKYQDYLAQNIFQPLNMHNTGSNADEVVVDNQARGYEAVNDTFQSAPPVVSPITLLGCGDLYSSLDDMYKWDQGLETEKIITKKSLETIFTPHAAIENSLTRSYGYGWFIDTKCNKRVIKCTGARRGFLSAIMRFIDDKVTIIILTNIEDQNQFCTIRDELPAIVFESLNQFHSPKNALTIEKGTSNG